ncbi:MAG UNVERIFIED_CONTAM: hypothetical protein LVR18_07945 [Planctomycetaceae bacterium]
MLPILTKNPAPPTHAATPKAAGIVPATGSLGNDYHEFSGATGSDERSSYPLPTPPPPKLRGLSPAPGSLSNDSHESSGATGSDERSSYPLLTPPPPKPRGLSPLPDR